MFAVSGLQLYCLSSEGIKQMSYNGNTSEGPNGWFLMENPHLHSHAEFIVAADYGPIATMIHSPLSYCGGFKDFTCEDGYDCVDNPVDGCDPEHGDAHCGGVCVETGTDVPAVSGFAAGIYTYVEPTDFPSGPEGWVSLAGPANRLAMDKYSGELYHISTWGGVYKHVSGTHWTQISGGEFKEVYAASDKVYAVHKTTNDIYRYSGSNRAWDKVGGPGYMFAIDRCGKLYGSSPDRSGVYEYTGSGTEWKRIGGPAGKIFAGGCGQLFATNPDSHDLYRYE
jgi:hypothetical protein